MIHVPIATALLFTMTDGTPIVLSAVDCGEFAEELLFVDTSPLLGLVTEHPLFAQDAVERLVGGLQDQQPNGGDGLLAIDKCNLFFHEKGLVSISWLAWCWQVWRSTKYRHHDGYPSCRVFFPAHTGC